MVYNPVKIMSTKVFHNTTTYTEQSEQRLPDYLSRDKNGKLIVDKKQIHEGAPGPYIFLSDFQKDLINLQEPTDLKTEVEGLFVHSEDKKNPLIKEAFRQITLVANLPEVASGKLPFEDKSLGILYSAAFAVGYTPVLKQAASVASMNATLIAPLRGGKVVQVIGEAAGLIGDNSKKEEFPIGHVLEVRASRVVLNDGSYLVGMFTPENQIEMTDNVIIGDDCRAAGGSELTAILYALSKNPKINRIVAAMGMGVKRTSLAMQEYWQAQGENITYEAHLGELTNAMNKDYYLNTTAEERKAKNLPETALFTVNDMGTIMGFSGQRGREITRVVKKIAAGRFSGEDVIERVSSITEETNQDKRLKKLASVTDKLSFDAFSA